MLGGSPFRIMRMPRRHKLGSGGSKLAALDAPRVPSIEKRVAFWIGSLNPTGITTSIVRVAEALAKQGVSVDLVLSKRSGPCVVSDSVRVVDLDCKHPRLGQSLPRVMKYLLRERPSNMCVPYGPGSIVAAFARFSGIGTHVWIAIRSTKQYRELARDIEDQKKSALRKAWSKLVRVTYRLSDRLLITTAHGLIANSQAAAVEIAADHRISKDRIHVIYNACVTDKIDEQEYIWDDRQQEPHRPPMIVTVGRMSAVKDHDCLIRAFAILRKQRSARLIIVGDGPLRPSLQDLIAGLGLANEVAVAGFHLQPFAYIGRADLFVLSSTTEPFGNAVVEAMARGWPVVSTDCVGPREILEGGRYGRLVPVRDHAALARAMEDVLDNPHDPDILRARALEFHADRVASQYCKAFGVMH